MAPAPTSKDEIDEQEEDGRSSDLEIGTNGSHRTSQISIALRYHLKILISLCCELPLLATQFDLRFIPCQACLSRIFSSVQADVAGACSCGILRQTVTPDLFTRLSNNNINSRYVILRCAAQFVIR
ncbi:hypothetical protein C5167_003972 [Papaver somniferum]|nr:hypothetical protein C5167_003972 [Papaver somniferum]